MNKYGCLLALALLVSLAGCSAPPPQPGVLYQVSTIRALQEGAFDGQVTCAELLRHGDLGLGTF